jgi:hypothetical protein
VKRNRPVPDVCSDVVEKARIEAIKRGHSVSEQLLADGSFEVTIQLGGVA